MAMHFLLLLPSTPTSDSAADPHMQGLRATCTRTPQPRGLSAARARGSAQPRICAQEKNQRQAPVKTEMIMKGKMRKKADFLP